MAHNVSRIARELAGCSVHIRMQPRPRNLRDSREILKNLENFGEVVMYRNLKYESEHPAPNIAVAIFANASSAQKLLSSSPLSISLDSQLPQSSILISPTDPPAKKPPATTGGGIEDINSPSKLDNPSETDRFPDIEVSPPSPEPPKPFLTHLHISPSYLSHPDYISRQYYYGEWIPSGETQAARDLSTRVPYPAYADCDIRKSAVPLRVRNKRLDLRTQRREDVQSTLSTLGATPPSHTPTSGDTAKPPYNSILYALCRENLRAVSEQNMWKATGRRVQLGIKSAAEEREINIKKAEEKNKNVQEKRRQKERQKELQETYDAELDFETLRQHEPAPGMGVVSPEALGLRARLRRQEEGIQTNSPEVDTSAPEKEAGIATSTTTTEEYNPDPTTTTNEDPNTTTPSKPTTHLPTPQQPPSSPSPTTPTPKEPPQPQTILSYKGKPLSEIHGKFVKLRLDLKTGSWIFESRTNGEYRSEEQFRRDMVWVHWKRVEDGEGGGNGRLVMRGSTE
ncbi:MAG: hypothetical protein M1834_005725 [Cirrosporium novae-zelandiae]|nr:MAG: hypothetical protein M1834_005725 [Cirrosporium novae-zelandiae]